MAGFAPTAEIQTPQDESWRSRPLMPDQSLAGLFKTGTEAIGGTVGYLYNQAKTDIWNQASSTVDSIVGSQPGVANALNRAGGDNLNQILSGNPTLASSYSDLSKNKTAMDQGVMDRSMYWAKMSIAAKELRSKYPGWGEDISTMFNNLTGYHTIEGHLDNAVYEENVAKGNASDKLNNFRWSEFTRLNPLMMANPDSAKVATGIAQGTVRIDDPAAIQTMQATAALDGQNLNIEHQLTQLRLAKESGKDTASQAATTYANDVSNLVTSVVNIANPMSKTGQNTLTMLGLLKSDDPATPGMISQTGNWLGIQKTSLQSRFADLRNKYRSLGMTESQFSAIEASELKPIDDMIGLAGGKEPTLLAAYGNLWKSIKDQGATNIAQALPVFGKLASAGMISPELASSLALKDPQITAALTKMISGDTGDSATQMLNGGRNPNPAQASRTVGSAISTAADAIAAGNLKGQPATDFIRNNLTTDRKGLDDYFTNLSPSGKQAFFEKLTTPDFQKRVLEADKTSPGLASQFSAWASSKFAAVPSVVGVGGQIAQSQQASNTPSTNVTYNYDPIQGGFTATFPKTGNGFGMGGISDIAKQKIQSDLNGFNNAISHMAVLYKNMGVDPQDPVKGIPGLLKSLQIPGQQQYGPLIEKFNEYHGPNKLEDTPDKASDLSDWKKTLENGGQPQSQSQGQVLNYAASADRNSPALNAINNQAPGADDFVTAAAKHETHMQNIPNSQGAKNYGYFQFGPDSWNSTVAKHPELGMEKDPGDGSAIMGHNFDDQSSVYKAYVSNNAKTLDDAGIPVTDKNVFMSSFLGGNGAVRFMHGLQSNPGDEATKHVDPRAIRANRTIFYDKDGDPRSLSQVYTLMTGKFGSENTTGYSPQTQASE